MFSNMGDSGKPKRLTPWDYAKVVGPSVLGSMGLMALVHGGFGKLRNVKGLKFLHPDYELPLPKIFPKFMKAPGFPGYVAAEAAVDAPITMLSMMKAQHDINKKQNGLAKISGIGVKM